MLLLLLYIYVFVIIYCTVRTGSRREKENDLAGPQIDIPDSKYKVNILFYSPAVLFHSINILCSKSQQRSTGCVTQGFWMNLRPPSASWSLLPELEGHQLSTHALCTL